MIDAVDLQAATAASIDEIRKAFVENSLDEFGFYIQKLGGNEFRFICKDPELFHSCVKALYLICLKYYENLEN